jgi:2-keto-4-pentenoate hydratase/2-oxohepta-3-ene-1,7-dioic acid hydratase in catechol pathway
MSQRFARLALGDDRRVFVELAEGVAHVLDEAPWLGGTRTGEQLSNVDEQGRPAASEMRRLAPVTPSKILCVGRNYRAHAEELGNTVPSEPLMFFKPPSALLDPDGVIELPTLSQRVEHEVELGVVIGQRARNIDERAAADAIAGYTIVGDITARDLQRADKLWTRGKGFDTFCPVGPVVVSDTRSSPAISSPPEPPLASALWWTATACSSPSTASASSSSPCAPPRASVERP